MCPLPRKDKIQNAYILGNIGVTLVKEKMMENPLRRFRVEACTKKAIDGTSEKCI